MLVLTAIVALYEETGGPSRFDPLVEATGLPEDDVKRALRALESEQPPFLEKVQKAMGGAYMLVGVPTGHARRAVGAWPTAEALATRLVAGIEAAADQVDDEEKKGWLEKTAAYLGNAGRDIAVDIAATAINKQTGSAP